MSEPSIVSPCHGAPIKAWVWSYQAEVEIECTECHRLFDAAGEFVSL